MPVVGPIPSLATTSARVSGNSKNSFALHFDHAPYRVERGSSNLAVSSTCVLAAFQQLFFHSTQVVMERWFCTTVVFNGSAGRAPNLSVSSARSASSTK